MISNLLKNRTFEDIFNDDKNFSEKESNNKQAYSELMSSLESKFDKKDNTNTGERDLRLMLAKIMDISDYLQQRYIANKENYPTIDENEIKLTKKEENGI